MTLFIASMKVHSEHYLERLNAATPELPRYHARTRRAIPQDIFLKHTYDQRAATPFEFLRVFVERTIAWQNALSPTRLCRFHQFKGQLLRAGRVLDAKNDTPNAM